VQRILVTPRSVTRSGHPALARLEQAGYAVVLSTPGVQPDEASLMALLPGCSGYLAGVERVSARVMESARKTLKVIARNGVGLDNVDLDAARRLGIQVLPATGANARGVAELTLALVLALARSVPSSDAAIKAGQWTRREGTELDGKVLGLIGCGRIGQLVARMAAGLDMKVIGYDPCPAASPAGWLEYRTFEEVLAKADFVSLHCPAPDDDRPIIDAAALGRMKPGAYVVNTARAGILDSAAVLAALESGRLAGVAIDVFDREPPGDDPLVRHPRTIATPHLGGYTRESVDRAISAAVENILGVLGKA